MDFNSTVLAIHQNLLDTSPEHARIFRFILLSQQDPVAYAADEHGRTPVHYAVAMDVSDVMTTYLQSNTHIYNVNWIDNLGQTALHAALSRFPVKTPNDHDYQQTTYTLLRHGADPNFSPCGPTPLMLAVLKEDVDVVRMLLDAGADPNQRYDMEGVLFKRGDTALSLALRLNALGPNPAPFTQPQLVIIGLLIQSAALSPNVLFHALQQTKNANVKKYIMNCADLPKI
jgi:ankyrin repeat protein